MPHLEETSAAWEKRWWSTEMRKSESDGDPGGGKLMGPYPPRQPALPGWMEELRQEVGEHDIVPIQTAQIDRVIQQAPVRNSQGFDGWVVSDWRGTSRNTASS